MSWAVHWHPVVVDDVRRMHWRAATEVCAAVLLFARTGRGVTIERTDVAGEIRLVSPSGVALVRVDADARVLHVRRVSAAERSVFDRAAWPRLAAPWTITPSPPTDLA